MDAVRALADLTEISSQIEAAVLLDESGSIAASTFSDEGRTARVTGAAKDLLAAAESVHGGSASLTQLEAATLDGSVFIVQDGGRTIAAATSPEPTVGLVFYDLKSCLRNVAEEEKRKPKRAAPKKPEAEQGPDAAS